MASSRWALRAAATLTALAFALPFSSGTANADPILVLLQDNHVNATVGVSGNVNMIDVAAHAHVSVDTGHGISVMANGGIQVALGLCAHADVSVNAGIGLGAHIATVAEADVAAHVDAVVEVAADANGSADRTPAVVTETVVEPVVTAAPAVTTEAVTTEAVTEDKTNSVHIGGISINVGPHAAAMLDAHAGVNGDVSLDVDVNASVGAEAGVSVESSLVNVDAGAAVGADASVDLGSGDVSASAFIGVGLTIG